MSAAANVVATAILTEVAALSIGNPVMKIAMPDVTFVPEKDSKGAILPYLQADLFFNDTRWSGLSEGQVDQGQLQITVVMPPRKGLITPLALRDAVLAAFPLAHRFGARVAKVSKAPWHSTPLYLASETRTPITIPWTA
jgi:hypothetical protein